MIQQIINYEIDEKLSEMEKYRAKEIALNIKFGYDRKETEESSYSESTSKAEICNPEDFENEENNGVSPFVEKQADPKRVEAEELDLQFKNQNNSQVNDRSHLFLILAGASDYIDMIYFVLYFQRYGGIYSLIPYIFFVVLLSFPISIYEVALAQFSSLPIFSMFYQMAPILGGIPHLLLYGRCLYIIHIAFRPKLFSFTYNLIYSVLTGDKEWMHCTNIEGFPCYDPVLNCDLNEDQVFGKCEPSVEMNVVLQKTASKVDQYARIHNLEYFGMAGTQITSYVKDLDASDLLTSAFLFFLLLGLAFHTGYRGVSRIAAFVLALPIIGLIPIACLVYFVADEVVYDKILEREDVEQLSNVTTYLYAILEAFRTTQIGQGTLFTIGSKTSFTHNFFKDMVFNALFGVGYRLFFLMTLLPAYYYCQMLMYPDDLDPINEDMGRYEMIELLFEGLPFLGDSRIALTMVAFFFATINLAMIAKNLVTFEIVKSCIYKVMPRLSYSSDQIVGLVMNVFFISILMIHERLDIDMDQKYYESGSAKSKFNYSLMAGLFMSCMYTMIGVRNVYGDKRLYINCCTMLRRHTRSCRMVIIFRDYFLFTWMIAPVIILFPFVLCTIAAMPIYEAFSFYYAFIAGFPIIYSVWIIWRTYLLKRNVGRLGSSYQWKPVHWMNERDAANAEKGFWNLD